MKRIILIVAALVSVGLLSGCAKEKKVATTPAPAGPTVVPDVPDDDGGDDDDGDGYADGDNEVPLKIAGSSAEARRLRLSEMFVNGTVNSPTNVRIAVAIANEGNGTYGGDVTISFEDGGKTRSAVLSTQHPLYAGTSDTSPNVWFNYGGEVVFHGFFQDLYGSIVLVIDDAINLGDGQPADLVGGRVYFQNFGPSPAPQGPAKMCWQIDLGPYDCRTFISGGKVKTTTALYPNNYGQESNPPRQAYKLLGTFGGLLRAAAFSE